MSLRRKFVLILVAFSLLLMGVGGWLSWRLTSGALERELDEKLMWVAGAAAEVGLDGNAVVQGLTIPGDSLELLYTSNRAKLVGLQEYVDEAYIFRRDNTSLITSQPPTLYPIGMPLRWLEAYDRELEAAWDGGEAVTPLFQGADGRLYKYGFKRLQDSDAMIGVLMQADFLEPLYAFRRTVLAGSGVAAVLAALLAGLLATNVARPLERLSRAALRIQRGRWEQPVEMKREDELGRLSRAMERMRTGIMERDEQLRLMLAQVAHEIRNPLGGLELFATAALEADDPDERRRLLARVRSEVEALNAIINNFLTFARPLHPEVRLHDVRGPLREAAELTGLQVRKEGGALEVNLPEEPLMARADPDHVKRIVLNLLQNGAQAGRQIWLDAWWRNGEAVISIRDDGPGIPPDARERIFEPFVTDKEKGAGLGLAIVQRLLEGNGGRLELLDPDREPDPDEPVGPVGTGAEFRVYFSGSEELPVMEHS